MYRYRVSCRSFLSELVAITCIWILLGSAPSWIWFFYYARPHHPFVQLCSNLEALGCQKSVWFLSACRAVSPERIFCRHPGQHWYEFSFQLCSAVSQSFTSFWCRCYHQSSLDIIRRTSSTSIMVSCLHSREQIHTDRFNREPLTSQDLQQNQCDTVWYCPIMTQHHFKTMSIISFIAFLSFQIWRVDWCEIWFMAMLDCFRHMKLG